MAGATLSFLWVLLLCALCVQLSDCSAVAGSHAVVEGTPKSKCMFNTDTNSCHVPLEMLSVLPKPVSVQERLLLHLAALSYSCSLVTNVKDCKSSKNQYCIFSKEKKACTLNPNAVLPRAMYMLSCPKTHVRAAATCRLRHECTDDTACVDKGDFGCVAQPVARMMPKEMYSWHAALVRGDAAVWGKCPAAATYRKLASLCRLRKRERCVQDKRCVWLMNGKERSKGDCAARVTVIQDLVASLGKGALSDAYAAASNECKALETPLCKFNATFTLKPSVFASYADIQTALEGLGTAQPSAPKATPTKPAKPSGTTPKTPANPPVKTPKTPTATPASAQPTPVPARKKRKQSRKRQPGRQQNAANGRTRTNTPAAPKTHAAAQGAEGPAPKRQEASSQPASSKQHRIHPTTVAWTVLASVFALVGVGIAMDRATKGSKGKYQAVPAGPSTETPAAAAADSERTQPSGTLEMSALLPSTADTPATAS